MFSLLLGEARPVGTGQWGHGQPSREGKLSALPSASTLVK